MRIKIQFLRPSINSDRTVVTFENKTDKDIYIDGNIAEPLAMNEPKKLTWIQKVRGYDDLQSRCDSVEAMRDHYKEVFTEAMNSLAKQASIITEKSLELKLMEKVADNWMARLIDEHKINDVLSEKYNMIGRRLRFSVDHDVHVEIVIGNPVTLCKVSAPSKTGDVLLFSISVCRPTDQYNWKTGVIKSLENFCKERSTKKEMRVKLFAALSKKYPEVFCA